MISRTALLCALARAVHFQGKTEKIFEDEFAKDFLNLDDYREARKIARKIFPEDKDALIARNSLKKLLEQYFLPIILSRNRFAEDIVSVKQESGKVQYVLLGAGLDSFGLRNKSQNVEVFELDLRETQAFKKERVKSISENALSKVHFIEIDFNKESIAKKLMEAGFNSNLPSVFSILGVSYYIPVEIIFKTVSQIAQIAAPESGLVFDYYEKEKIGVPSSEKIMQLKRITSFCGESMVEGYEPAFVAKRLKQCGFKRVEDLSPKEIEHAFFKAETGLAAFDGVHLVYAEK